MMDWTLDRLRLALDDRLQGARPEGRSPLGAVSTDTRQLGRGDVFVALTGDRFDGHDYLADAVRAGASALVVSRASGLQGLGVPVLLVDDTLRALGDLARFRRRLWNGTVVAVAGSNGKTSTRDLVAAALSTTFRVHATRGNLNNLIGTPHTLLALPDESDVAVVEMGTNQPGEVARLRGIVEPDIAVITSIGEEHLEGLGSLAGVLQEECSACDGVSLAVTPASQPEVAAEARRRARAVVEAGLDAGSVRPQRWGMGDDARGWFEIDRTRMEIPLVGLHNLRNAMLALTVARACGVPDEATARGLAGVAQPAMRSALEALGALLVLNDAYNANPASAREALATVEAMATSRPRVLVLGSMLELGAQSAALHDEIADRALASRAQVVAGVGLFNEALQRRGAGDARVIGAADAESLWPALRERLPANALVLLKGSRGTRLERLVPLLRELAGLPPAVSALPH